MQLWVNNLTKQPQRERALLQSAHWSHYCHFDKGSLHRVQVWLGVWTFTNPTVQYTWKCIRIMKNFNMKMSLILKQKPLPHFACSSKALISTMSPSLKLTFGNASKLSTSSSSKAHQKDSKVPKIHTKRTYVSTTYNMSTANGHQTPQYFGDGYVWLLHLHGVLLRA